MRDDIIKRNMILIISCLVIFFFASLYIISYTNRKNLETELVNVSNILIQKLDRTVSEEEMNAEIGDFISNQDWLYIVVTNNYGNYVIDTSTDENLETAGRKLTSNELKLVNKLNDKDRIYINNGYIYKLNDNIIDRTGFEIESNTDYILLSIFYMLILIIVSFMISIYFSKKTSDRIIDALKKINTQLKNINNGEYKPIDTTHRYIEISEILEEINRNIYNNIIIHEQERERISFIINNVKQGIIVIDENKKLMFINSYVRKILKIDGDISEDACYLDYIDNEKFITAYNKVLENRIPIHIDYIDEKLERIYDFRFSFQSSDWKNENAPLGMVFIIINDVTEMREIDESRNEFISNASHELKTPITTISGFSELILSGVGNADDTVKNYISKIHKETIKMRNTINELLYLSNLDYRSSKFELNELVNLDLLIRDIVSEYTEKANERNISISYDSCGTGVIRGSESLIVHLITNLVDNAIKYNKDNGKVNINLVEEEKTVKITISDTGIGIPEVHIKKIFDRFYRVDKSRSRETGGTGLGLSIAKKICLVHNAKISVSSVVNESTTFEIIFSKN